MKPKLHLLCYSIIFAGTCDAWSATEIRMATVLPEAAPFYYVLGKDTWNQSPPVALPIPDQMTTMIPRFPDFIKPCTSNFTAALLQAESTLEIRQQGTGGLVLGWRPQADKLFKYSLQNGLNSEYHADIHVFCVGVFRRNESTVRCLLPLRPNREILSSENNKIALNMSGVTENLHARLPALDGVKLPSTVTCQPRGEKPVSFSLADAISISLRCRIVPRTVLRTHVNLGGRAGKMAAMPWETIELAAWSNGKPGVWKGDGEVTIKIAGTKSQESAAAYLSNLFHNVWTNSYSRAWSNSLQSLTEDERAQLSANLEERGDALIRAHCDSFFATLSKNAMKDILPPSFKANVQGHAIPGESERLPAPEFKVNSVTPEEANKNEYSWTEDRAAVFKNALTLLETAPKTTRLSILKHLKLAEAEGKIKTEEPARAFVITIPPNYEATIAELTGFPLYPELGLAPFRDVSVAGNISQWASGWPRFDFKVDIALETPEGRESAAWMKMKLFIHDHVVILLKRQ